MMDSFGKSVFLLGFVSFVTPVIAQPVSGLYIGGEEGIVLRAPSESASGHTRISTDPGPIGSAALGWGFGNGLRAEIEGSYRNNDISKIQKLRVNGLLLAGSNPTGREATAAAMANLFYDFDLARFGIPLSPYVGAGIGYGFRQFDHASIALPLILNLPFNNTASGPGISNLNGTFGQVAYQGIGGVSYPLAFLPGLALTAEYRFFAMPHTRFAGKATIPGEVFNGQVAASKNYGFEDNLSHSILIGLRYSFNAPAAPLPAAELPVPGAPQSQSRVFLVFFDWDRADLTDRARQIVGEAAAASRHAETTKLMVNGYTDRSGTAAYNQALSIRRAKAVAAELTRDGVAPAAIAIQGYGETHPLVPTASGVREPQNRRVEIIIQ